MSTNWLQLLFQVLALIAYGFAVKLMLNMRTVILPAWYLVLLFTLILFGVSFFLGYLVKSIFKPDWNWVTTSSLFIIVTCFAYFFTNYKPTYDITIPKNFAGDVILIVTEDQNDFILNRNGIGYINSKTYRNGFLPVIKRDGKDISGQIRGYSTGTYLTALPGIKLSFDYLTFEVPGPINKFQISDFDELIKLNYIDTTRIRKKLDN